MKQNCYREIIGETLEVKLYRHCLGVADAAQALALRYGADPAKAYRCGLVHDYGKRYTNNELLVRARRMGLPLDRVTLREGKLLHATVGAALLREELNIRDPEIIRAVAYHTTGRAGMSLLEKIIYLADYIERGRDYPGVRVIRRAASHSLQQALLAAVELAIHSVLERGLLLHPRSVAFRNELLLNQRSGTGCIKRAVLTFARRRR